MTLTRPIARKGSTAT